MDPESVRFMSREIIVLRRFDHPNVVRLEGMITSRVSVSLYLIFEYMDHDLAGLAAIPSIKFTEAPIKCYMQQFLHGVEHCHSRGVMHPDIKGSNLLLDSNGYLKIGDFRLATLFQPSNRKPLTSRVVTLWYRPPELLLGATDYGVTVDLWSVGCILAELFVGKPIMPGRTETFKDIPSSALSLLEVLLAVEPEDRGTASLALQHEFFTAMPRPCDPSTLPKYPPIKEFDAKLREEEARRRRAANKGYEHESVGRNFRESKAVPIPDANAEFQATMRRQGQCNSKCTIEKYNPQEDGDYGFHHEPEKSRALNGYANKNARMHHSGPLLAPEDNREEMLKEHERQIQQAVRKVRLGKDKTKNADSGNGLTESLFQHVRNRE
ncbi:putative serine/threonine-protein kinase [Glycine soja]